MLVVGAKFSETPNVIDLKLSSRLSYAFGITISSQLNRFLCIKAEPRFIAKGYDMNWSASEKDVFRSGYLSLPILLSLSPFKNFSIDFGPEVCHLLNSKVKTYSSNSFQNYNSPNLKPLELSIISGFNYYFLDRFDAGFRYGFGLTPYEYGPGIIADWPGSLPHYKITNRYFEFYLNTRLLSKSKK